MAKYRVHWSVGDDYGQDYEDVDADSQFEAEKKVRAMPLPSEALAECRRQVEYIEELVPAAERETPTQGPRLYPTVEEERRYRELKERYGIRG